jgi:hypothetical protein
VGFFFVFCFVVKNLPAAVNAPPTNLPPRWPAAATFTAQTSKFESERLAMFNVGFIHRHSLTIQQKSLLNKDRPSTGTLNPDEEVTRTMFIPFCCHKLAKVQSNHLCSLSLKASTTYILIYFPTKDGRLPNSVDTLLERLSYFGLHS